MGFLVGIVRWLAGLILGLASAALFFGLAARVASAPEVGVPVSSLTLLLGGFGIAFFPVVYTMGTRTPRSVLRRGFVGLIVEGLVALFLVAYSVVAKASPVPTSSLGWPAVNSLTLGLADFFRNDLQVGAFGLLIFAVGILLSIVLRGRAAAPRAATTATTATATTTTTAGRADAPTTRAPVLPPVRQAPIAGAPPLPKSAPVASTADEDAQLMADLENLRKKLPTMGVDESGTGKRP